MCLTCVCKLFSRIQFPQSGFLRFPLIRPVNESRRDGMANWIQFCIGNPSCYSPFELFVSGNAGEQCGFVDRSNIAWNLVRIFSSFEVSV